MGKNTAYFRGLHSNYLVPHNSDIFFYFSVFNFFYLITFVKFA